MHNLWCYHSVRKCNVFNSKNIVLVNYNLFYSKREDFRLVRAETNSEILVPSGGFCKAAQGDVETGGHENSVLFMG